MLHTTQVLVLINNSRFQTVLFDGNDLKKKAEIIVAECGVY